MLKPSWTNSYPDKQRKAVFNSESWGGESCTRGSLPISEKELKETSWRGESRSDKCCWVKKRS